MKNADSHLSDQKLLLEVEGELSAGEEKLVQSHLRECWKCRVRRQELADAIVDFVHFHQWESDANIPPVAGPRALLKARMAQLSTNEPVWPRFFHGFVPAAAICGLLALGLFLVRGSGGRHYSSRARTWVVSIPDSRLTPGATLLISRSAVCAQSNPNNKPVSASVQRRVFEEYGMAGADPRAYEVDYLVTPALGGADDIRNLWPHSHYATAWNAQVKDALEDRLRGMVCDGSLDLTEAQQEIASNWIAAYKKYFHTDQPIGSHWR